MNVLFLVIDTLLWMMMILLFLAGGVTFAFDPDRGRELLKRSGVLVVMLLLVRILSE